MGEDYRRDVPAVLAIPLDNIRNYWPDFKWRVTRYAYVDCIAGYHNRREMVLGQVNDMLRWTPEAIIRQIFGIFGEAEKLEGTLANITYDTSDEDANKSEGERAARALLPFMRTDVPLGSLTELARLVAKWSGYKANADFILGFVGVFMDYQQANNTRVLESPRNE